VSTRSPLESNSIGTAPDDLIAACADKGPSRSTLPPPPKEPAFALAFSGGGFRATLSALGVLRFVTDAGLLPQVRYVSSVSGGSVAHGILACAYPGLKSAGFTPQALDDLVIRPAVAVISTRSLTKTLFRNLWRTIGPRTRTNLLADEFNGWWFKDRLLEQLDEGCRFIFNASNVSTGVRFTFERDLLGDWVMGHAPTAGTGLRVADAVASSAAVPGAFAPYVVKGVSFPCANGRTAKLLDGGAYDNMGLEALDKLPTVCLVALNAGGVFRTGAYRGLPIVRDLQRANGLLYRQTTALRMRTMVERFKATEDALAAGQTVPGWGRLGVLFGLATTIPDATAEWTEGRPEHPEWREELAEVHTSFAEFPPELCERLLYRGWWLAGATLSRYHRSFLPSTLPTWRGLG
jgi:NTE family protein